MPVWLGSSAHGWPQFLLLSTLAHARDDGQPVALGYHTGHWEVGLQVRALQKSSPPRAVFPLPLTAAIRAMADRRELWACRLPALSQ